MNPNGSSSASSGGRSSTSISNPILLAVAFGFQIAYPPPPSLSQEWSVIVVDSSGIRPSIGVESDGQPHLVYFDYVDNGGPRFADSTRVKHATWDFGPQGFQCETTLVAAVHLQAGLAIDRTDAPHAIFHRHAPYGDPVHEFRDGSTWVHDMIPTDGHDGFSTSIILDSADRPHISFVDGESRGSPDGPGVEYAYYDGAQWFVEAVGSERNLSHYTGTSIALESGGSPAISYYDSVQHRLMLARKVSGEWNIELIDSAGDVGRSSSLDLDSQGFPRIAYLQVLPSGLGVIRVAIATDTGWAFMNIDTLYHMIIGRKEPESMISLQVDPDNVIHVAYSDTRVVKRAMLNGTEIVRETVLDLSATERTLGQSTSMVLDMQNVPHLAFFEDLGDSLGICLYATQSDRLRPQQVVPDFPEDGAVLEGDTVVLRWNEPRGGVDHYWLELSTDALFAIATVDSTIEDTTAAVSQLQQNQIYYWRARAHNYAGWGPFSQVWNFAFLVTGAEEAESIPATYSLSQNYPNPFNPSTVIRYGLPQQTHVMLEVFNMLGQRVNVLMDGLQNAGYHSAVFEAEGLPSGIYFYRLQAGGFVETKKIILMK